MYNFAIKIQWDKNNFIIKMGKHQNIRNIIFDFGGVIYDIDFGRLKNAFRRHGIEDYEALYAKNKQNDLFTDLEKGAISNEDFAGKFRLLTQLNISDQQVYDLWNEILVDYVKERIDAIKEASSNYRLFLMSNTNRIHYSYFARQFQEQFVGALPDLFEKVYLSFEMGMVKPDSRIFEQILAENKLIAQETLFIDDLDTNVYSAIKSGIKGSILTSDQDLKEFFEKGILKEDILII
ncbi:MAG: HAD family phosphatase [Bacteroidales bacterium]|nr:HAD family phosphatase [Bacteroidales bacterium]